MNDLLFEMRVCRMLAHSSTFFARQEWLPVADAVGFSKSSSQASQAVTQQQVGAQGGGSGSTTTVAGAYAQTGSRSTGNTAGKGATQINVSNTVNTDATVANSAIAGNTQVANAATEANAAVAGEAITSGNALATAAIQAGQQSTAQNAAFGEAALQFAQQAQATSTTALETNAAEYAAGLSEDTANAQITANNALTGNQQPVSQGTIPTIGGEVSSTSIATWIAIIGGLFGIAYYLEKKA